MPVFSYRGLNSAGKSASGIVDAESARAARAKLRRDGIFPTNLKQENVRNPTRFTLKTNVRELLMRVPADDLSLATRQFATLLGAGIPVSESLGALAEQIENELLQKIVSQVKQKVNEGQSLAKSLAEHPAVFSDLYVNMISAGENSGTLEIVLERLAEYIEGQVELRAKIRGALLYPIILTFVGLGVLAIMVFWVLPKIGTVFAATGRALPLLTRMLLGTSAFLTDWWWALLIVVAAAAWLVRRWLQTDEGRERFDRFALRAPIFGQLTRKVIIGRFTRTLATLLKGGVPILASLDIVSNIITNVIIRQAVETARDSITEGTSIAGPLSRSGVFPPLVTHMIMTGEKTGDLEGMLLRVSDSYDKEVERAVNNLTTVLEPVMILLMAGFVAFIALSLVVPILQMTQGLK
ncbi:MAG: type II secretion system inner membrane protein GspF [Candidatus Alcyoniella australis]|nr:type II secretion system inner membrane protein GspF [Candidatus Alcyoniella australis]